MSNKTTNVIVYTMEFNESGHDFEDIDLDDPSDVPIRKLYVSNFPYNVSIN